MATNGTPAGRNDPCPCGSGKKYKKCCLEKDEALRRGAAEAARAEAATHRHAEHCGDPSHHHGHHDHDHDHDHDHEHDHDQELDPFWHDHVDAPLDERLVRVREKLASDDGLDPSFLIDLLHSVSTELLQQRRAADLAALVDLFEAKRAQLADELRIFVRSLRAWIALAAPGDDRAALVALAEIAADDPDELIRVIDGYRYHGRIGAVVEALPPAFAATEELGEERPEIGDELQEIAAQATIAKALDDISDLKPDDPELQRRLQPFGEVDPTYLGELISRRTGHGARSIELAELLAVVTTEKAEELIFLLSLEMGGELVRSHRWNRGRAELASSELSAYLIERMLERGQRGPQGVKEALRGTPQRAGYLVPDSASLGLYLDQATDPLTGAAHRAGALLLAQPAWLGLLEQRGVIAAAEAADLEQQIRERSRGLDATISELSEDPDLIAEVRGAVAQAES